MGAGSNLAALGLLFSGLAGQQDVKFLHDYSCSYYTDKNLVNFSSLRKFEGDRCIIVNMKKNEEICEYLITQNLNKSLLKYA